MATDILAKRQTVGIIEETATAAWSTPATASTQFKRQGYDVGVALPDFGKTEDNFELTGSFSEMAEQGRRVNDSISGLKRIPFSGFLTEKNAADHLKAAFWDLYGTEGATTPYSKVFDCGDSQYAFESGDGVTFSVATDSNHSNTPSEINDGELLENAVIDSLTVEWDQLGTGQNKYVKMNGVWVGRELNTEQDFSSVWLNEDGTTYSNSYEPSYYNIGSASTNWFTLASTQLTVGGDNMGGCYRKFAMTLNNNITSDCVTTGGKPNNYKRTRDLSFTVDIPYNSSTYKAVKGYKDGDVVVLTAFNNGTSWSNDGGLEFGHAINYLTASPKIIEGDYFAIRFEFMAYRPNAGFIGIVGMSDSIDKGW